MSKSGMEHFLPVGEELPACEQCGCPTYGSRFCGSCISTLEAEPLADRLRGAKVIKWYRRNVYGRELCYVLDKGDAAILLQLTGRMTITGAERELLRDLTAGFIAWEEVIAP